MVVRAEWVAAVLTSAVGFASVSALVAVRRAYFLAAGLTHAALLAASVGLLASELVGGSRLAWTLAAMLAAVAPLARALGREGADPERVSAVFVAATASLSVLALHQAAAVAPAAEVLALVVGDPLLTSWEDVAEAGSVASLAAAVLALTYREQVCAAVDRDGARLAGLRVWLYDLLFLVALSVAVAGLLRLSGFVLAHVYLLLPGATAMAVAERASAVPLASLLAAVAAGLVGLAVAVAADVAPSGAIGLAMLAIYAASTARRGWWP